MGPFRDGWTMADAEEILARGNPGELLFVPIVVSLDPPDGEWAQAICALLATHPDPCVRGNAILGLGQLARSLGRLDEGIARPLIAKALRDEDAYVRCHASSAASDASRFLGWPLT